MCNGVETGQIYRKGDRLYRITRTGREYHRGVRVDANGKAIGTKHHMIFRENIEPGPNVRFILQEKQPADVKA